MKKFFSIVLAFTVVLCMNITAFAQGSDEPFKYDKDEVYEMVEGNMKALATYFCDEDTLEYYADSAVGVEKSMLSAYYDCIKDNDLGKLVDFKKDSIKNNETSITVTVISNYEKGKLKTTAEVKELNMYNSATGAFVKNMVITDCQIELYGGDSEKSMADSLKDAALNTVMGISIVVCLLLLISFLISLFKYIPKIQEMFAKKDKKQDSPAAIDNTVAQIEKKEEKSDDTELVAVITAAICAATGSSSDSFVVRSIKRRR